MDKLFVAFNEGAAQYVASKAGVIEKSPHEHDTAQKSSNTSVTSKEDEEVWHLA